MADSAALYRQGRETISELTRNLSDEELLLEAPATAGWSIRDIVGHLAGDAACIIAGDFPEAFFQSFGAAEVIPVLNSWTDLHVSSRAELSLDEVLEEWDRSAFTVERMMRGEEPWPENIPFFADRVLLTDLGVHEQDIYGALGVTRNRDNPLIRLGTAGYVATIGFRLAGTGLPPLEITAGDSTRRSHEGEPAAGVSGERFEMFRALSGRRSPEQIRALTWTGDPEPYIEYFYPYGIREEALVEP